MSKNKHPDEAVEYPVDLKPEIRRGAYLILCALTVVGVLLWITICGSAFAAAMDRVNLDTPGESRAYKRSYFRHWTDDDRDCENTRAETLITHSMLPVLKNKDGKGCRVIHGLWYDPYSGKNFSEAKDLDIDHIVPLKAAWISGADQWHKAKRRAFANDPDNLLAVQARENRQKGAKDIVDWKPSNTAYHCEYALRWLLVKVKYQLRIATKEWQELSLCNSDYTASSAR